MKDKSAPAHSIEFVEDLQRYIEKLEKERDDAILEKQVANTSIDLLSCRVKELEQQIIDLGNNL